MTRLRYTLACVAALVVLGSVSAAPGDDVLQIGNPGSPASLDPHKITGVWENRIVGDMFVGLTTEGSDGSIQPGAAERWTRSEDGLEYTFWIREHVWSDGKPVTANDFEYAFKRMLAPASASPYADFFFVIAGAEDFTTGGGTAGDVAVHALDEQRLQIVLRRPTAYFTGLLMHFAAMPVPRHVIEELGDDWTDVEHIVVNGPFVLDERVPNSHLRLRRNPRFYAADDVALDAVVHHVQEDRSAAVQRFRSGEFHIVRDFPSGRAAWLRDNLEPGVVHTGPFLGLSFIAINHRRPALQDKRVRRALSMALDRETIATVVLGSGEQAAHGLVPAGTANYGAPARHAWQSWDAQRRIAAAREAMQAAGYGPDRPLSLTLRYAVSENDRRVAIAAQSMWKQVWANVELLGAETAVHYSNLQNGSFDIGLASWLAVYSDPQTFTLLLESKTVANNFGGYKNAEYDRLTELAQATPDLIERAVHLRQAEVLALEEAALIPIYHHAARNLVSPVVSGWEDNVLDVHRSRYLSVGTR